MLLGASCGAQLVDQYHERTDSMDLDGVLRETCGCRVPQMGSTPGVANEGSARVSGLSAPRDCAARGTGSPPDVTPRMRSTRIGLTVHPAAHEAGCQGTV